MSGEAGSLLSQLEQLSPQGYLVDERLGIGKAFIAQGLRATGREGTNIERIARHAPLAAFKLQRAAELGIFDNGSLTPEARRYLDEGGKLDLAGACSSARGMSRGEWIDRALGLLRIGYAEFHPTDKCNAACTRCINAQTAALAESSGHTFPFARLDVWKRLAPKRIMLVGGGEPTIYKDGKNGFAELVARLRELLPDVRFGLVTNGTFYPPGDWESLFDVVRISLGAVEPTGYRSRKGLDAFEKVIENAGRYLRSSIPRIAFNYTVHRNSFEDCLEYVRFVYRLAAGVGPEAVAKAGVEFRPLVIAPNISRKTGETLALAGLDVLPKQLGAMRQNLAGTHLDPTETRFILENTNLEDCLAGTRSHWPTEFPRCWLALLFVQLRARGDLLPCSVRCDDAVSRLGDVLSEESMLHAAVKQFRIFAKDTGDDLCSGVSCRRHAKNRAAALGHSLYIENGNAEQLTASPAEIAKALDAYERNHDPGIEWLF